MAKRPQPSVFNAGTVVNVLMIPVLTGIITIIGFYFLTNYRLNENTDDIKAEIAAREKASAQFFDKLSTLNDSLAKLNTNVAVQATALDGIKQALQQRR